jgi:hypothetical protein
LDSENNFTVELRKILTYKEELLTNVKNMLYRRADDIERLQKVIADTEQQFVGCRKKGAAAKGAGEPQGGPPRS